MAKARSLDLKDYEEGAPFDGDYDAELKKLQDRLSKLQVAHKLSLRKTMIAFEGWDAAGKGGAIQRLTATWDPRNYEVWPIAAPSFEEKSRHFLWRFWKALPIAGDIAVFDRSWYGRVLVEWVEGYIDANLRKRAFDEINEFEAQQRADGVLTIKIFLHVRADEQDKRLSARLEHKWKRWKITRDDFRNRARRDDYLTAMRDMFAETNTRWAPWHIVDGNDKKAARLAVLRIVAEQLERFVPSEPPPMDEDFLRYARTQLNGEKKPEAE
ncbi:polyphosphate kinase 2 family protein [Sphingomonas montanisoli]|uniref:Polyphosphate kinase n=1 Tax=Sphingomonas montanisoli TaxID=2606412 RepID=A0A5D9CAE5_9SPHN|nr:polyphosphate kinase [Sphingomonas montanisoli]TZG28908.1 polyphosphate kinase [Sphingomonas montanisoli]